MQLISFPFCKRPVIISWLQPLVGKTRFTFTGYETKRPPLHIGIISNMSTLLPLFRILAKIIQISFCYVSGCPARFKGM